MASQDEAPRSRDMFDRITISRVPTSQKARIAFTLLKPVGWDAQQIGECLALGPRWRHDAGFAVLMPNRDKDGPTRLLGGSSGLSGYLREECPELSWVDVADEDDEMCPYELEFFRGRVDGVAGRIILIGTAVRIEDVNFALIGFARDEQFHTMHGLFRSIVSSFQPIVTAVS